MTDQEKEAFRSWHEARLEVLGYTGAVRAELVRARERWLGSLPKPKAQVNAGF